MNPLQNQINTPFLGQANRFSPIAPQNSLMGMMSMFSMMMEIMTMVMSSMVNGNNLMSQSPGQFGNPQRGQGFGSGSPLSSFLGASPQSNPGNVNKTNGTFAPPSNGNTNSKTQNFIDLAKAKQGSPYVFGAQGNGKYDCSGLVHAALNEAGVRGQRLTARGYQAKYKNSRVSKADLKPGDLVFFHSKNTRGIPQGKATHIEIYLGNGMTMGTDNPKEGAKIEPINWSTFIGGARVPELN